MPTDQKPGYAVQALLLTCHGFVDQEQWLRWAAFVEDRQREWHVKHWCTTLETTSAGKLHVHTIMQFTEQVHHTTVRYTFEELRPRADSHDLLGEGWCRKKLQESFDRAFFYCWAEKDGQVYDAQGRPCTKGNYEPAWTKALYNYPVRWRWAHNLWWKYKLCNKKYDRYLFLCRDGTQGRKRYLDNWQQRAEAEAEAEEMAVVVKRVRGNFTRPFPVVPAAVDWLACFKEERDRLPFLVVVGLSHTGKTEWAKSLFKAPLELKIGKLDHFPDKLREFSRKEHDAVILDDCRDFGWLVAQQEKLQGKYDLRVELGSTPGGQLAYSKWLWRIPLVVTANLTTKNPGLLENDDFLGQPANRVVVNFPLPQPADGVVANLP